MEETVKTLMAFDANDDGKLSRSRNCPDASRDFSTAPMGIRTASWPRMKFVRWRQHKPRRRSPKDAAAAGRGDGPGGEMNFIRFDPILAAVDTNGDGVISADEIKNSAEAIRKLDKDGDGKVTREEATPQRGPGHGNKKPMKPLFITATAFLALAASFATVGTRSTATPWRTAHYENVLGTSMEIKLIAASDSAEERAEAAALAELERSNSVLSGYDSTSEFSRWARTRNQATHVSSRVDGGTEESLGFLAKAHRRRA